MTTTAVHPGGANTYVPSTEATNNMQVDFSRNPASFPINRWLYIVPVTKTRGLYTRMTVEECMRLLYDGEEDWAYGEDEPQDRGRVEKFELPGFTTRRKRYGFRIPTETAQETPWDIKAQHARIVMQRAMTRRTERACNKIQTAANWPTSNTIDVSSIPNVGGKWDVSTTARMSIKRSLIYGAQVVQKQTGSVVKPSDLKLLIGPDTAAAMVVSQEIVDFIKGSTDAREYINNKLGPNAFYGLPRALYGHEVIVEDSVKNTSAKGAATQNKDWVFDSDKPVLLYRQPGQPSATDEGLVGPENSNEAPTFTTVTCFVREDMTVETKDDVDNRVQKGRVVDNFAIEISAPISGFLYTDALT